MKHFSALENIKCITEIAPVSLTEEISATFKGELKKKVVAQVQTVEIYRIVYRVKKLCVVGYVVIPKVGNDLPCILHLRGGSRDFGMVTANGIIGNLLPYAAEGYVVITTQYPGVEGGDGMDTLGGSDDMAAIKKLRTILRGLSVADVNTIGVKGHSRGGLMVYMLLREVRWVKAAVATGAPVDQVLQIDKRKNWKKKQIEMWGGGKAEAVKRSPIRWVDELPKKVPLLIAHGSADWRVSPQHSFDMSEALRKRNYPHRFIFFEGADHKMTEYKKEFNRVRMDWFSRWLKEKDKLPNMKLHGR